MRAAEAAECAGDQGNFWKYHEKLVEEWGGENQGAFGDTNLKRFAEELNIEKETFNLCFEGGSHEAKVQNDYQAALNLGVQATPTVFINDKKLVGPQEYEVYQQIIDEELAKEGP